MKSKFPTSSKKKSETLQESWEGNGGVTGRRDAVTDLSDTLNVKVSGFIASKKENAKDVAIVKGIVQYLGKRC